MSLSLPACASWMCFRPCLRVCFRARVFSLVPKLQATPPASTWARSWCVWSRHTAGSVWSVRPAPCASSRTTRTRWCSATNVTVGTTRSAWAWTPSPPVSGRTCLQRNRASRVSFWRLSPRARTQTSSQTFSFTNWFCVFDRLLVNNSGLSVSSGLWVCEVCDTDFSTPKRKVAAKTQKKSAQKWSTGIRHCLKSADNMTTPYRMHLVLTSKPRAPQTRPALARCRWSNVSQSSTASLHMCYWVSTCTLQPQPALLCYIIYTIWILYGSEEDKFNQIHPDVLN